jgi:hypothetical protein
MTIVGINTAEDVTSETHDEPVKYWRPFVLVLNITKPAAGVGIRSLCALVIRGGKSPLVVLLTSNCAEATGVEVPIPTFCDLAILRQNKNEKIIIPFFIIVSFAYFNPG